MMPRTPVKKEEGQKGREGRGKGEGRLRNGCRGGEVDALDINAALTIARRRT